MNISAADYAELKKATPQRFLVAFGWRLGRESTKIPCCNRARWFNARMNLPDAVFGPESPGIFDVQTRASGPAGSLPLTEEMLLMSRAAICSA